MPSYQDRSELIKILSNQAYFDALNKPKDAAKPIQDVGTDGQTGRSLLRHPDGGVTSNGVKQFNTAVPQDRFVSARIDPYSNAIAIDGRQRKEVDKARVLETVEEYPIIKLDPGDLQTFDGSALFCDGQVFYGKNGSSIIEMDLDGNTSVYLELDFVTPSMMYSPSKKQFYLPKPDNRGMAIVENKEVISTIAIPPVNSGGEILGGSDDFRYVESMNRIYFLSLESISSTSNGYGFIYGIYLRIIDPERGLIESLEITKVKPHPVGISPRVSFGAFGDDRFLYDWGIYLDTDIYPPPFTYYYTYGFFDIISKTPSNYTRSYIDPPQIYFAETIPVASNSIFNVFVQDVAANSSRGKVSVNTRTGAISAPPENLSTVEIITDYLEGAFYGIKYGSPATVQAFDPTGENRLLTENLPVDSFNGYGVRTAYCAETNRLYLVGRVDGLPEGDTKTVWLIPYNLDTGEFS